MYGSETYPCVISPSIKFDQTGFRTLGNAGTCVSVDADPQIYTTSWLRSQLFLHWPPCLLLIHSAPPSRLALPEGACTWTFFLQYTSRDTHTHAHTHPHHGSCTEPHSGVVVVYLFSLAAFLRCVLRHGRRRRWTRQALIHGGDVQRGGAHRSTLCHVLRPVVSEQSPSFSQWL